MWYSGQDLKLAHPEYKSEVTSLHDILSFVTWITEYNVVQCSLIIQCCFLLIPSVGSYAGHGYIVSTVHLKWGTVD
jgi:hypothetical protein